MSADVKWLVCEEICIPEEANAELSLPLIDGAITPLPSPGAKAIRAARAALPEPMPWAAKFDFGAERVTLRIENVAEQLPRGGEIRFFPLEWGHISHAAPQKAVFDKGDLILDLERGDFAGETEPAALGGVIAVETPGADGRTERRGYSISAAPSEVPIAAPGAAAPIAGGSGGGLSLAVALGFALLGGLILNLMPCVFPVLSLKALSLARDAGNSEVRRIKGLVYLAGVLASFALIGAVLVALRGGGSAIGWGTQFQSPVFILAMMALFLALALNMSGAFTIGGSVAGLGDSLTRRSGLSGYFFTGVLATVVATPCTAPFMGAAMGYAFTQPAVTVFAVLLALGFGFALPIVLLSLTPALGGWLPKPGPWMETFKQLMAFPLYATVAWLVWVISIQRGSDGVVAASIVLLGVGFAAWLVGHRAETGKFRGAAAALIAVLAIGLGWSATGPAARQAGIGDGASQESGLRAETFTQARLDELIARNRPIFVNLTAAWCITCKVNERVALSSRRIADAFSNQGIAYLVGDWTNGNAEITELLKAHGRVGVPLYLLYSGEPGAAPRILPQLLTESMVLDRLAELPSAPLKQAKGEH
jgi:thiol:disulfide interchange protein DsbD